MATTLVFSFIARRSFNFASYIHLAAHAGYNDEFKLQDV
jgi:hypothetical protein